MPAVQDSSLILLTGASGFLAAHVGQQLLQRGYRVRGTVRSAEKGEYLKELYKKDGLADKFEYVIVEDIEQDGAFDSAVQGVDGIAHTASPFHFRVEDPHKDLINPAVQGTKGLLSSAAKEKKVQRVVITSSFAAVVEPKEPVYTFTESDWNEFSPAQVSEHGVKVDPSQAYRASKTLAEKAAWSFLSSSESSPSFDIATVNPPLIFGPVIHQITSAKALNTSVAAFYAYLQGTKSSSDAQAAAGSYVDVRDVARIHVEALCTPEAGGKRFLVSSSSFSYNDLLVELQASEEGNKLLQGEFPKAVKGEMGKESPRQNRIETKRARETFGWQPIATDKMLIDMTRSLAERQKEW